MQIVDADALAETLDFPSIVSALDDAFRSNITVPLRHHHTVPVDGGRDATLLLMPAWQDGRFIGVKTVCVMPENAAKSLPAVQATYQLFDHGTGQPLALIDGRELTARRTAAASALASRYLSTTDATVLLMVGTGVLAPHLIRAHASQRPISRVLVWGRNRDKAAALVAGLGSEPFAVEVAEDLDEAVGLADIVSCATLSLDPLVKGDLLQPGQHLDLVGGFAPEMRETDDEAIRRARVYIDTTGALEEAGDICQPVADGTLDPGDIQGDLFQLCRRERPGRQSEGEITLFKSAGTAIEDLAAAALAYARI